MPISYTSRRPRNWDLWPERLSRDRFVHDWDDWKDFDDDFTLRRRSHIRRKSDESAEVIKENDGFKVKLDVSHFKPEEITVKFADNHVVVSGKHDEVRDKHGYVSRQFSRRYELPEDYDSNKLLSTLSSDGILEIKAPLKPPKTYSNGERVVPIKQV